MNPRSLGHEPNELPTAPLRYIKQLRTEGIVPLCTRSYAAFLPIRNIVCISLTVTTSGYLSINISSVLALSDKKLPGTHSRQFFASYSDMPCGNCLLLISGATFYPQGLLVPAASSRLRKPYDSSTAYGAAHPRRA